MTKLYENEMDRAEIILAAKAVMDDLQQMSEKLAKTEAEGIMPLLDSIRTLFGPQYADSLSQAAQTALRGALDAVQGAKEQIGINVGNMEQIVTGTGPGNDMATNVGLPQEPAAPEADMGAAPEGDMAPEAGAEGGEDVSDEEIDDLFGGDDAPVGRETKESVQARSINMLRESANPDRLLLQATFMRMKAGQSGMKAIQETAKQFGVDADDIIEIVREFKSKK